MVIPVYKSADFLVELHRRVRDALHSIQANYHFIFVDDKSPDRANTILRELIAVDPRVAVLAMKDNVGQQRAVRAGLRECDSEITIVMDGDLQDSPEAIVPLIAELDRGHSIVFAERRGKYESSGRLLTSRIFKTTLHHISTVPNRVGMFIVMKQEVVKLILDFRAPRPFIVSMVGLTGLPISSIVVERSPRQSGESAYTSWKRIRVAMLALAWTTWWRLVPSSRRGGRNLYQEQAELIRENNHDPGLTTMAGTDE